MGVTIRPPTVDTLFGEPIHKAALHKPLRSEATTLEAHYSDVPDDHMLQCEVKEHYFIVMYTDNKDNPQEGMWLDRWARRESGLKLFEHSKFRHGDF